MAKEQDVAVRVSHFKAREPVVSVLWRHMHGELIYLVNIEQRELQRMPQPPTPPAKAKSWLIQYERPSLIL